jgi:hypothetical protein
MQQNEVVMTTLTSDRLAPARGRFRQWEDGWLSWLGDIAVGVLVFAALLDLGALPIALRFWLAMPELTRFPN